ncbi:AMP-binding protein, partial [Candidatus Bathyarchaeota archaeon]|nr:AMP-binding protein [Candidatus Bathyarchaeota archaeon]
DWICSQLAVLRVGAAYVPFDPKLGPDRLSLIAKDCQPVAILVDPHTKGDSFIAGLPTPAPAVIDVATLPSTYGTGALPNSATPDGAAVIIYSSGSTGRPKGIVLSHAGIANYADVAPPIWGLREGREVFLNQASYSFDISLQQSIVALGIGSTVVVVGDQARGDPAALSQLIADEGVTVTGATPTEYQTWARHWDPELLRRSQWRHAFTWGEPITRQQVREFRLLDVAALRVIDAYGPAEATITSAHGDVSLDATDGPESPRSPLSVTPNGSVYIVDEKLNPVPAGVPGEIVLGGAAVAKGYLNDEALTVERFIHDRFASPYFKSKGWTLPIAREIEAS